jgi:hypothetical protein
MSTGRAADSRYTARFFVTVVTSGRIDISQEIDIGAGAFREPRG